MAMASGQDDGGSRAATADHEHSSSDGSEHGEDEIATISDVFADMLIANEDILRAAAEYQLDNDILSIMAYQRILHRNLVEMADFVDSVFGVYNKANPDDTKKEDAVEVEQEKDTVEDTTIGSQENQDKDTEEDAATETRAADLFQGANDGISKEAATWKRMQMRQPERMRSLLIDRFRLENKRRMEQRTARLWRKMRRKVRVEEGVSVVMSQAAERIAQITVAAVRQPPPVGKTVATPEPPTGTEVSPHCSHSSAAGLSTPLPSAPATPSDASSHSRQEANASASIPSTLTTAAHSPPPVSPMIHSPLHGSQPRLTMSLLPPPIAATQSSGAMLLPFGAGNFSKVPLPPMSSGLNMFYQMPTPPTLYPPNHMSSVCADCVPLGRTAHECRSILKHITPTPPSAQQPVVLAPPPMWPLAFNGVMGAVPAPVRSVPTMRAATPVTNSAFKRMCEECKKNHKSVHHCRRILGHTTPEWLSGLPDADAKPRKRRSRQEMQMMKEMAKNQV